MVGAAPTPAEKRASMNGIVPQKLLQASVKQARRISCTVVSTERRRTRRALLSLQNKFLYMLTIIDSADARPTEQARQAVTELEATLQLVLNRWQDVAASLRN